MSVNTFQHIIVTRPITTASPLLHRLAALGLHPLPFPALEIVDNPKIKAYFQTFTHSYFDIVLFISPTAVHSAMKLCALNTLLWPTTQFIAQGPGTAKTLMHYGFTSIIVPENNYSTEGLLALPILNQVKGQKIAIFKGAGGRDALAPYLERQGAQLSRFDCYERRCPTTNIDLSTQIDRPKNSLFILTSCAGLHNLAVLLHFAQPMNKPDWRDCHLLIINDKMKSLARELGHKGKISLADNASDDAIIQCILTLVGAGNTP